MRKQMIRKKFSPEARSGILRLSHDAFNPMQTDKGSVENAIAQVRSRDKLYKEVSSTVN